MSETAPAAADPFGRPFAITVGHEGSNWDRTYGDDGNWTGGKVGNGLLRGSKFGISAAAHPCVDIENLTLADAEAIYRSDYWAPIRGAILPAPLGVIVFDAAVNNGVEQAIRFLQEAVGVPNDGDFGPETANGLARVANDIPSVAADFMALRTDFMARNPKWQLFGKGWSVRLQKLPLQAFGLLD
jgi:lysozyme family protein